MAFIPIYQVESPSLVVGLTSGGINTNAVPDECVIRVDRRLIPEEDALQVESELRSVCRRCDKKVLKLNLNEFYWQIVSVLHLQILL